MHRRWIAVIGAGALVACLWGAGHRCNTAKTDVTVAQTGGPFHARLVVRAGSHGAAVRLGETTRMGARAGGTWLEVENPTWPIPSEVRLWRSVPSHHDVELQHDPAGQRFAYRETDAGDLGNAPWRLVFPTVQGAFVLPSVPTHRGRIDWHGAPQFEQAAPRLFDRAGFREQEALLREVEGRGGPQALADFLLQVVDTHPKGTRAQRIRDGAWGAAFDRLPASDRAWLASRMTRAFLSHDGLLPRWTLLRSLRYINLTSDPVLDRIEERLVEDTIPPRMANVMLRALSAARPDHAAPIACAALDGFQPEAILAPGQAASTYYREAVLASIAAGSSPCAVARQARNGLLKGGLEGRLDDAQESHRFARLERRASQGELLRGVSPRADLTRANRRTVGVKRLRALLRAAAKAG